LKPSKLAEKIAQHERFALQFSGGKDSLACLYLLKPWWDKLVVLWGNPGDEFPEIAAQIQRIGKLVRVVEVRGNSRYDSAAAYPVDVLPLRATPVGRAIEPEGARVTLQSKFDCCWRNFWQPMTEKVKELGITLLIRGQRDSEFLRAPIRDDSRDPSGAEIFLPIREWSQQDVVDYLVSQDVELPVYYQYMSAGPKCLHCTAWLDDQKGKLAYLRRFHPDSAQEYSRRMMLVSVELEHAAAEFRNALDQVNGEAQQYPLEKTRG
jgi:3'-phosphoadenosine 5'-phosphosulfate sulfotransferase (PAPS reductase)/FAD synthetase